MPSECAGQHPPFGPPPGVLPNLGDWHYPEEDPAEAAALVAPVLLSGGNSTATFRDPTTGQKTTVAIGHFTDSGWQLMHASAKTAVVEHRFDRWSAVAMLAVSEAPRVMRSPVGRLAALRQPRYPLEQFSPSWHCKQTADPADWLRRIAQNMSGGHEATFAAAASVMAPNTNVGVFGNPIELNKFVLYERGDLATFGPGGSKHHNTSHAFTDTHPIIQVADFMPEECPGNFSEHKSGMLGRFLRVVVVGLLDTASGCAAELVAVSPPAAQTQPQPVSTALVRVVTTSTHGTNRTVRYLRAGLGSQTPAEWGEGV